MSVGRKYPAGRSRKCEKCEKNQLDTPTLPRRQPPPLCRLSVSCDLFLSSAPPIIKPSNHSFRHGSIHRVRTTGPRSATQRRATTTNTSSRPDETRIEIYEYTSLLPRSLGRMSRKVTLPSTSQKSHQSAQWPTSFWVCCYGCQAPS